MTGLLYALALFGCTDDATYCERLVDKARTYESRVACEMATVMAMDSSALRRADYPTVIGKCMTTGQWARLGDRPVNLATPDIRLASR